MEKRITIFKSIKVKKDTHKLFTRHAKRINKGKRDKATHDDIIRGFLK